MMKRRKYQHETCGLLPMIAEEISGTYFIGYMVSVTGSLLFIASDFEMNMNINFESWILILYCLMIFVFLFSFLKEQVIENE